jgi:hypothetical protein
MSERDAIRDAILNNRDRWEEIKAEWEKLGMEPRRQSPTEMRRVLMTWTKAELVAKSIRDASAEIRARNLMLEAWADAEKVRTEALVLPRETKGHVMGAANPFAVWLKEQHGHSMAAKTVFTAGWAARARAEIALSGDGEIDHEQ